MTTPQRPGPLKLGAAFQTALQSSDSQYRVQLLSHGYSVLTPEFEQYMDQICPTKQGEFDFSLPDAALAFATANGCELHGHVLMWDKQVPAWVTNPAVPWTAATLTAVMVDWIDTCVHRYRGKIKLWHVINEPIQDGQSGALNPNSIWGKVIGPNYIQIALGAAHAADPAALLYINEYSTEWVYPKSNALYAMAKGLLAAGAPLHGIGFQLHSDTRWPIPQADLITNMARFGALGLRTDVTELDVGVLDFAGTEAQKQVAQAQIYQSAVNAAKASPSCFNFTTWGFTDKVSWLPAGSEGLPFDVNYRAKPAWPIVQGLANV
jgi:endo-1,4-beta-xylanase